LVHNALNGKFIRMMRILPHDNNSSALVGSFLPALVRALLATFVASVVMGDSCGSIRLARLSENWAELCGHKVVWIFAPDLNPISRHIPVLLCHDLTFGLFG
jgi:hypothetical protein